MFDDIPPEDGFWIALAISAGAAGISAVWNGLVNPMLKPMLPDT